MLLRARVDKSTWFGTVQILSLRSYLVDSFDSILEFPQVSDSNCKFCVLVASSNERYRMTSAQWRRDEADVYPREMQAAWPKTKIAGKFPALRTTHHVNESGS